MTKALPLALLFMALCLGAQSQTITLSQAIDMGIKYNPALKLSQDKIRAAEAKVQQGREMQLPQSKASASWSQFDLLNPFEIIMPPSPEPLFGLPSGAFDATMASVSVGEVIFGGMRIQNGIKAASYLQKATEIDASKNKEDFAFNLTAAYYSIYKIMKSQQLISQNLKVLEEKQREIKSLVDAGVATQNDLLRIQLQKSNTELSKEEVDNALDLSLYNLKLTIGLPENNTIAIDTAGLLAGDQPGDYTTYEQSALKNRPELQSNQWKLKAAQTNIKIIEGSRYPNLALGLGYNYINPGKAFIPEKNTFVNAWNIGVNLSWNITSLYGEKGKLAEANAAISQLNDANDLQVNAIKTETYQNYRAWKLAEEKIAVTKESIGQAEENYREQESRYRNNVSTLSDMLEANTLLLQARLNQVNAEADAQLAYFKLLHAAGEFSVK